MNGRGEIPKEKIEEIEAFGVKCVGVSGDISDYEKAGQMIKEAEEKLGSSLHYDLDFTDTNDKLEPYFDLIYS
ncbi:hypothetical protein EfmAA610_10540 [Enterococcus faecium]|nr:hypothetical protein EfmAA610_10540 [Enterococcus faecium]